MLDYILSLKNSFLIYCLLSKNCNISLCSGAIPCQFKQTIITPLLKKPGQDPNDLKNFQPVSDLPFISKILEKKVLTQLQKHLSENDLLEISPHTERTTVQRQLYLVLLTVFSKMPMTDWSQCWLCYTSVWHLTCWTIPYCCRGLRPQLAFLALCFTGLCPI